MADIHTTAGELMGTVRDRFYVPDGKAPDGYSDARDMKLLRYWLERGLDRDDIEDAIRGLAKMRDDGAAKWLEPGEKLTLRILNPKEARYGRHIAQTARDYWREHQRRKQKPLNMAMPSQDELVARLANAMDEAKGRAARARNPSPPEPGTTATTPHQQPPSWTPWGWTPCRSTHETHKPVSGSGSVRPHGWS